MPRQIFPNASGESPGKSGVPDELRQSYLFEGLSDDEILEFVGLFPCCIKNFGKDDCIISRDEASRAIGMVLEGTLGIYADSLHGGHTLIGIGDRTYFFGFIARFFNGEKSITTLYCRKHCKVAFFAIEDGWEPEDFIRRTNPRILVNLCAMLTKQIRDNFDRMHIVSAVSVRVRFVRYLLNRHAQTGLTSFDLLFNHSELANYLGVYRTSLSREISKLSRLGLIRMEKSVVNIKQIDEIINIERESYG